MTAEPSIDIQSLLNRHTVKMQGNKTYLTVAGRLLWFRKEHPDYGIVTTPIEINTEKQYAIFSAQIFNAEGKLLSTATKFENARGFGDYIEKAETGSVGRALLFLGYGTDAAAHELEEGERLADSPQPSENRPATAQNTPAQQRENLAAKNAATAAMDEFAKLGRELGYYYDDADGVNRHVSDLLFGEGNRKKGFLTAEDYREATARLTEQHKPAPYPEPQGHQMPPVLFANEDETAAARNYTDETPRGGKRR